MVIWISVAIIIFLVASVVADIYTDSHPEPNPIYDGMEDEP